MSFLFAFLLFVSSFALFFMPNLWIGSFHNYLLVGAIAWFTIYRLIIREWKRRINIISEKYGSQFYEQSQRKLDNFVYGGRPPSVDFLQNYEQNIQQSIFLTQDRLKTTGMLFSACSLMWLFYWLISTFAEIK